MKKALAILAVSTLFLACSSSDNDEPVPDRRPQRGGYGGGFGGGPRNDGFQRRRSENPGGLEVLPPDNWWSNPDLTQSLNLSGDQLQSLDKIGKEQGDEIARMQRDTQVAVRDLRDLLGTDKPATPDLIASGQRLRTLRDNIFDRQVQMLAAERSVLSQKQWQQLQDTLENPRQRNNDNGPRRGMGGGRGGFGGRGRGPGWPG